MISSSNGMIMLGSLSNEQIDNVLRDEVVGRIGCTIGKRMYIVPVAYAYSHGFIYARSREGLKIRAMRRNPSVCFQVDSIDDLGNWRSVLAWGEFEELKGNAERTNGIQILEDRLLPLKASEATKPARADHDDSGLLQKPSRTIIYRIRIQEKTGRFEKS